ncbi:MAG: hypothetical protein PHV02_13705 [Rhodocyclaceae bacterium]|nr:hypothetical protein [Rhodocyclaceae bacterium]
MKAYTLSLSRWHKVAERLSRTYTELTQNSRQTLINTQVSGYLGETQIARLVEQREKAMANIEHAFAIQDSIVAIRRILGEANARIGVARELAEQDALTRRQKFLESIVVAQGSEMVRLEELSSLPKQIVSEDRYDRSRGQVRVGLLDETQLAGIKKQADGLLSRVYTLADRVSDLNRERLSIELPEATAAAAGL